MKNFTHEVVSEIKESEQNYKHDNLTTTECPTCGKFMIKVKTKMDKCWFVRIRNVKLKRIFKEKPMRVVQIAIKNDVVWKRKRSSISLCVRTY